MWWQAWYVTHLNPKAYLLLVHIHLTNEILEWGIMRCQWNNKYHYQRGWWRQSQATGLVTVNIVISGFIDCPCTSASFPLRYIANTIYYYHHIALSITTIISNVPSKFNHRATVGTKRKAQPTESQMRGAMQFKVRQEEFVAEVLLVSTPH